MKETEKEVERTKGGKSILNDDFEGKMWGVIVLIPDHCLSI